MNLNYNSNLFKMIKPRFEESYVLKLIGSLKHINLKIWKIYSNGLNNTMLVFVDFLWYKSKFCHHSLLLLLLLLLLILVFLCPLWTPKNQLGFAIWTQSQKTVNYYSEFRSTPLPLFHLTLFLFTGFWKTAV